MGQGSAAQVTKNMLANEGFGSFYKVRLLCFVLFNGVGGFAVTLKLFMGFKCLKKQKLVFLGEKIVRIVKTLLQLLESIS